MRQNGRQSLDGMGDEEFVNWNGKEVGRAGVGLAVGERGWAMGVGVFETIRLEGGRSAHWGWHAERLLRGMEVMEIGDGAWRRALVRDLPGRLEGLARRMGLSGLARARVTVTPGVQPAGFEIDPGAEPGVLVQAWSLPAEFAGGGGERRGVVGVSPWRRNEASPLAGVKATSYAESYVAMRHARARGWDEAVMLNGRGEVCECCAANLFWVGKDGVLHTPALETGCLAGTMRRSVLAWAERLGVEARETVESGVGRLLEENVAGVFLTTALRGVVPVRRLEAGESGAREFDRVTEVERMLGEVVFRSAESDEAG